MPLKKKILFSTILVFICLLILEGISAIGIMIIDSNGKAGIQQHQFHPLRKHVYPPNHYVRSDWQDLKTDERGYIISPDAPENPDFVVVLTGSSSARSTKPFTSAEHTLAASLQAELNETHNMNVKVVNLAVAGYSAFHEYMSLYEYFEEYRGEADIVISANGLYSIDGLARHLGKRMKAQANYPLYNRQMTGEVNAVMEGSFPAALRAFGKALINLDFNTSELFLRGMLWLEGVSKKNKGHASKTEIVDYQEDELAHALYKNLLDREYEIYSFMRQVAENRGAPYMLALLPARYTWVNFNPEKLEKNVVFQRRKLFTESFYDDFLSREPSYPVLDLRRSFDGLTAENVPYTGKETVHYNPVGMEALARDIAPQVVRLLKKND